jgi:hypothetical protein
MRCPKCATELDVGGEKYDLRRGCPVCGWTHVDGELANKPSGELDVSPGQWVICLLLTLLFVAGPCLLLHVVHPPWATTRFLWVYYGAGWLAYLLVAIVLLPGQKPYPIFTLRYRLFGPYWIDWSSLATALLTLLLAPALIVMAAIAGTIRYPAMAWHNWLRTRALRRALAQREEP